MNLLLLGSDSGSASLDEPELPIPTTHDLLDSVGLSGQAESQDTDNTIGDPVDVRDPALASVEFPSSQNMQCGHGDMLYNVLETPVSPISPTKVISMICISITINCNFC